MKKYIKEIVISSISVLVLGMAIMLYDYRTLLLREAREGFSKLEWFVMDDRFAKALMIVMLIAGIFIFASLISGIIKFIKQHYRAPIQ